MWRWLLGGAGWKGRKRARLDEEEAQDELACVGDEGMSKARAEASQEKLVVCVRLKPLLDLEEGPLEVLRPVDENLVVLLPKNATSLHKKDFAARSATRKKNAERRYAFDLVVGATVGNRSLYEQTLAKAISDIQAGYNVTVFAYGATGSGKTHTMIGSSIEPGLIPLAVEDMFSCIKHDAQHGWEVTCSFLEVYNESIFDLTRHTSEPLELRVGPNKEPVVAGLCHHKVSSVDTVQRILQRGNARRKTEATEANETSSRSHAVFEMTAKRGERNQFSKSITCGKLTMVDLAGAERAKDTQNDGKQLRDGASINNSLLALANCINALGKKGGSHVPFRNSKLTRLLQDALCGNSKTLMIANVSSSLFQYDHTVNTLKYADRAKEIKTKVIPTVDCIRLHVTEYQRLIAQLQAENRVLREENSELRSRTLHGSIHSIPVE